MKFRGIDHYTLLSTCKLPVSRSHQALCQPGSADDANSIYRFLDCCEMHYPVNACRLDLTLLTNRGCTCCESWKARAGLVAGWHHMSVQIIDWWCGCGLKESL